MQEKPEAQTDTNEVDDSPMQSSETSMRWLKEVPAWGISLAAHALFILVLASLTLTVNKPIEETIVFSDVTEEREPVEYAFETKVSESLGNDSTLDTTPQAMSMTTETIEEAEKEFEKSVEEELEEPDISITDVVPQPTVADLTGKVSVMGNTEHTGGVGGSMDRMTFEISSSLNEGPTVVLWMFDASISLDKRRVAIKERFENVNRQLGLHKNAQNGALKTVVASFGQELKIMTKEPTSDEEQLISAVQKIQPDSSGKEYVFQSAETLARRFLNWRTKKDHNMMMVIVTDERGDDLQTHLEKSISTMRRYGIRCYCIGNAALFGRQRGYVRFTWKEGDNEFTEELPVEQGPETLYPQRLELRFWGNSSYDIERMSANYGPYGLTRLCAETGGLYLVTADTRGANFDPDIMANYSPDYRPVRLHDATIKKSKTKMVLLQAAKESQLQDISQPQLIFRAENDANLRQGITEAQKLFVIFDAHLQQLQAILEPGEKARHLVKEPRWRAGFDLAMGRVMAMRARAYGYNVVLADMKNSPKPFKNVKNNHWRLKSSTTINGGIRIRKLAEKAEEYLNKVIEEHSGTPWEVLARHELKRPMGWDWEEMFIEIPKPMMNNNNNNNTPNPTPPKPPVRPKNRPKL